MIDHLKPLVSDALLAIAIVLAVFLVWLGGIINGWSTDNEVEDAGSFVASIGMLVLVVVLFAGGLIRADMDKWVRVAMIIGAVLLMSWVGFWPGEAAIDINWPY
jgi:high-affinity Fe2+/Pb2+ permease